MAKPQIPETKKAEVLAWIDLARAFGRSFKWEKVKHQWSPDKMFTEEYNKKMLEAELELSKQYSVDCLLKISDDREKGLLINDTYMYLNYRKTHSGDSHIHLCIQKLIYKDEGNPASYNGHITESYQFDGSDISWLTDLFGKPETAM